METETLSHSTTLKIWPVLAQITQERKWSVTAAREAAFLISRLAKMQIFYLVKATVGIKIKRKFYLAPPRTV